MVKVHREAGELFTSNLHRTTELKREFARVEAFLNDYTSLPSGARNFSDDIKSIYGKFGGQYEHGYDESVIDADAAKNAFELYDRIVERAGGWEQVVGMFKGNQDNKTAYDSSTLITQIYDMVIHNKSEQDIIENALKIVDENVQAYDELAQLQRSNTNYGALIERDFNDAYAGWFRWVRRGRK